MEERLKAYEEMQRGINEEYGRITDQMERLKTEGRVKFATYRQLMGRKLTYSAMLELYRVYGLEPERKTEG